MDKILSARVDEIVLNKISFLAQRLHVSKKKVIEGAVEQYAQRMESAGDMNVFVQTSGAWKRKESIEKTVTQARSSFRKSMERHQQ
jgi:uridine kinase